MSKYVLCTLAHASLSINGIDFEKAEGHHGAVVSVDPVPEADAERFASIPGYELLDEKPGAAPVKAPKEPKEPKPPKAPKAAKAEGETKTEAETKPEEQSPPTEGGEGDKPSDAETKTEA